MPLLSDCPETEALTRRDRPLHKPDDSPGAASPALPGVATPPLASDLHKPGDFPGVASILVGLLFFAGWIAFTAAMLTIVRERPPVATPPHYAAEWNWYIR